MLEFLKAIIRTNGEIEYVEILNLFSFTLKDIYLIGVIITWKTTQIVLLQNYN
jgi:hypothetical protein